MNFKKLINRCAKETNSFQLLQRLFPKNLNCSHFSHRVKIVTGNLEKGNLGISPEQYNFLAQSISVIYQDEWKYLYSAIDENGETIDFYLSHRRNAKATTHFIKKLVKLVPNSPKKKIKLQEVEYIKFFSPCGSSTRCSGLLASKSSLLLNPHVTATALTPHCLAASISLGSSPT